MRLILEFHLFPSPRGPDRADNGLAACVHGDVLYRDLLLDFAAMAVERVEQHRIGARELVCLRQVLKAVSKSPCLDTIQKTAKLNIYTKARRKCIW
jgi:hypothetical protein